jgi:tetratricopeptide (TPR) repeat protein
MKASAKLPLPFLLALGLCAAPALAANEGRGLASSGSASSSQANVAQLNEEGAAFYAARDYRHAIEKFIQAYAVDSDPNLLFNIARCYEELGETDAAIEKYETFLKTPGADARGRQRARESLTALREAAETARNNAAPRHSGAGEQPGGSSAGTDGATAEHAEAASGSSYWPWVVLGGSVAAAAVGTTFYLMGVSDHDEVTGAPGFGDATAVSSMTRARAQELVDSGDSKKLIGGVSLGLAGVLAVTYVVLLVTEGHASASESPSLALDWSPKGSSLRLQGSF